MKKKAWQLWKWKYHKLMLLILTFIFAYLLFKGRNFTAFNQWITSLGYLGVFISGMLFSYGFTAAPATAILLLLSKQTSLIPTLFMGTFGALASDILIFQFIRASFRDELRKLAKEKIVLSVNRRIPQWLKLYIMPVLAGLIIASPLPDEIGVALMASTTKIPLKAFIVLSFLLNGFGILIIILIGKVI